MSNLERNKGVYAEFAAAWHDKDLSRLNAMIADDAVYGGSVGPEPGTTYRGRDAVMRGFAEMLAFDPGISTTDGVVYVGDRAYVEWSYRTIEEGREIVSLRGMDIVEFNEGKITRKEAFRKALGSPTRNAQK